MEPEVVELGKGINEDDLLFHDERSPEPSLAYLLSRMRYEDGRPAIVWCCCALPCKFGRSSAWGALPDATSDARSELYECRISLPLFGSRFN